MADGDIEPRAGSHNDLSSHKFSDNGTGEPFVDGLLEAADSYFSQAAMVESSFAGTRGTHARSASPESGTGDAFIDVLLSDAESYFEIEGVHALRPTRASAVESERVYENRGFRGRELKRPIRVASRTSQDQGFASSAQGGVLALCADPAPISVESSSGASDGRRGMTAPELSAPSYLQSVLSIAYRDEGNSVPLTVATSAGLVFGNAVHPTAWLRRLGEQLRDLTRDDPHNESAQAMASMFDQMAEERNDDTPGRDIPMKDIHWIYFTDALIAPVHNAVPAYQEPACWQIALRDVTGWTIGLPPA